MLFFRDQCGYPYGKSSAVKASGLVSVFVPMRTMDMAM
jgi:hypothetical protein